MKILQSLRTSVASAGLAAASLSTSALPAQQPERETAKDNPPAATAQWDSALTLPAARQEISEANGAQEQDSEKDSASDPAAIVRGLQDEATKSDTLDLLTPELLEHTEVVTAVLQAFQNETPLSPRVANLLLSSDAFMCQATSLSVEDYLAKHMFLWRNTLSIGQPELIAPFVPNIASQFAQVYRSVDDNKFGPVLVFLTPACLRQAPELQTAFKEMLERDPLNISFIEAANSFGMTNHQLFKIFAGLTIDSDPSRKKQITALLAKHITPESLQEHPEIHRTILNYLHESPRDWPTGPVTSSEAFTKMICEEIKRDFSFASRVPPFLCAKNSPSANQRIRETILEGASNLLLNVPEVPGAPREAVIVQDILPKIPVVALEDTALREQIREICHSAHLQMLYFAAPLNDIAFFEDFARAVPEILRLPCHRTRFQDITSSQQANLVTINPRAFSKILDLQPAISKEAIDSLSRTVEAFHCLGITVLSGFDNGREILRNRYAISDSAMQERLRTLMPSGYFDGIEEDIRPYAIVLKPAPSADSTNVLSSSIEGHFESDYIDRLTNYYRVVLFEASDVDKCVNELASVRDNKALKAEVFVIMGHGDPESISLSKDSFLGEKRELTAQDPKIFRLAGLMQKGGSIALISCSTAAEQSKLGESVHTTFTKAFPDCYIYAPEGDTRRPYLQLSKTGKFTGIVYNSTRTVAYDPVSKKVTREPGIDTSTVEMDDPAIGSWISELRNRASSMAERIVICGAIFSGLLGISKLQKRIKEALHEANRLAKQPVLFPTVEDTWSSRFLRAVWNGPAKARRALPSEGGDDASSRNP